MGKYRRTFRFARHSLAAAVMMIGSWPAGGAENQRHPLLVDPAKTRCVVCHKDLQGEHHAGAEPGRCVSCHSFVKGDAGTFVSLVGRAQPLEPTVTVAGEKDVNVVGERRQADVVVLAPAPDSSAPTAAAARAAPEPVQAQKDHYAEGLAAFERADLEAAFGNWREMLEERLGMYTIQIEMDDHVESARSTLQNNPGAGFYVLKKGGKYHVLSGFYGSLEEAAAAVQKLPKSMRAGGAFPISVPKVLRD